MVGDNPEFNLDGGEEDEGKSSSGDEDCLADEESVHREHSQQPSSPKKPLQKLVKSFRKRLHHTLGGQSAHRSKAELVDQRQQHQTQSVHHPSPSMTDSLPQTTTTIKRPPTTISAWWNDTWRNALFAGGAMDRSSRNHSTADTPHTMTATATTAPILPSSDAPQSQKRDEIHPPNLKSILHVPNFREPWEREHQVKNITRCIDCETEIYFRDYDGDHENDDRRGTGGDHNKESGERKERSEHDGEIIPSHGDDLESGQYLDQGGEVLDDTGNTFQLANHRIAEALNDLKEDWFHFRVKRVSTLNLRIRARHRKSRGLKKSERLQESTAEDLFWS